MTDMSPQLKRYYEHCQNNDAYKSVKKAYFRQYYEANRQKIRDKTDRYKQMYPDKMRLYTEQSNERIRIERQQGRKLKANERAKIRATQRDAQQSDIYKPPLPVQAMIDFTDG